MTTITNKIRAAIAAASPDTQALHADFIAAAVCKVLADHDLVRSEILAIAAELVGDSEDEQSEPEPEPTDAELLDIFYGVNQPGMTGIEVEQLRVVWRAGRDSATS